MITQGHYHSGYKGLKYGNRSVCCWLIATMATGLKARCQAPKQGNEREVWGCCVSGGRAGRLVVQCLSSSCPHVRSVLNKTLNCEWLWTNSECNVQLHGWLLCGAAREKGPKNKMSV